MHTWLFRVAITRKVFLFLFFLGVGGLGGLYLFWSILETLTELAALSDEARPAGTLSAHVVAVCAVLTAAHLGALGAVETRRTTCRERPVNFHNTLPRHQLFTRRRSSKQQHVWRKRGFCATGFNLLHGSSPPVQSKSSPVQSSQLLNTTSSWSSSSSRLKLTTGLSNKRLHTQSRWEKAAFTLTFLLW